MPRDHLGGALLWLPRGRTPGPSQQIGDSILLDGGVGLRVSAKQPSKQDRAAREAHGRASRFASVTWHCRQLWRSG